MLQPYIQRSTLIHKLVLFDQPHVIFTFQDHSIRDPCIALPHQDQLTGSFRANIRAFPVTAYRIRITRSHTRIYMYSIYSISTRYYR